MKETLKPTDTDGLKELYADLMFYTSLYKDLQKERIATSHRIKAWERGKIAERYRVILSHNEVAQSIREMVGPSLIEVQEKGEAAIRKQIRQLARKHFMADWVEEQRGFGMDSFGILIGMIGPMDVYPTVSKVWKMCGLHVGSDGRAAHRIRGQQFVSRETADLLGVEATAYNPTARSFCYVIGDSLLKANGYYAEVIRERRAFYLDKPRLGDSGCPMGQVHKDSRGKVLQCVREEDGKEISAHIHNAAKRYGVKELLKWMWVEWKRQATIALETMAELPVESDVNGQSPSETHASNAVAAAEILRTLGVKRLGQSLHSVLRSELDSSLERPPHV